MAYTTIDKSDEYFNTVTYTASGPGQSVTGVNFQPDLVWLKRRSAIGNHYLVDSVRGVQKSLFSNDTAAESSDNYVTSFNSDGFSLGADNYTSPSTLVGWNWLASNTTAANTDGSISSTVSVNTTSGFSIVSYSGDNTNTTIGHGLGIAPNMIIIKNRTNTTNYWATYHSSLGNGQLLRINAADAAVSAGYWNNTSPTNSVFSTQANNLEVNQSGSNYIAYCFAEKKGFSKFGSYIGNGNADGTFVYTGFKPAYLMIKNVDLGAGFGFWAIWDNKRNTYNPENIYLEANANSADNSGDTGGVDFLSNGFKLKNAFDYSNKVSTNYIYMAFAENPLVTSGGTPTTAR